MSEQIKIYLSYSDRNLGVVKKFSDYLKQAGYYVWFAEDEILPGDNWQSAIDEAISNSNVFLYFLPFFSVRNAAKDLKLECCKAIAHEQTKRLRIC